jgi:adenosylcobinamide-GDP ribazoletransferase
LPESCLRDSWGRNHPTAIEWNIARGALATRLQNSLTKKALTGPIAMNNLYRHFSTAVTFLTILPVPFFRPQVIAATDLAKSFSFFPLTGLIIGSFCLIGSLMLRSWMPPVLTAVTLTAMLALLTRGLHLDGLADLADGIGGGYTSERRLQIMKDSRIGTFGTVALVFAIVYKAAALYTILQAGHWAPLLLVPAFSRFTMVLTAYKSSYARAEGGLGKPFLEHMTARQALIAGILSCLPALLLAPISLVLYLPAALLCAAAFRLLSNRLLGGITGDVLGATNEVSELVLFTISACAAAYF